MHLGKDTVPRRSLKERSRLRRLSVGALLGVAVLAGCGKDIPSGTTTVTRTITSAEPAPTTTQPAPATSELSPPFKVTRKWELPPRKTLKPRIMTEELCAEGFWWDKDGRRRPAVQRNPLILRVDGRCNSPLEIEENGIYKSPKQEGKAPITVVNGEALGVECYTEGQAIQDIRGPSTSSEVWVGVVTREGETGYFPWTNTGFTPLGDTKQC